jgi:hypothetical protein
MTTTEKGISTHTTLKVPEKQKAGKELTTNTLKRTIMYMWIPQERYHAKEEHILRGREAILTRWVCSGEILDYNGTRTPQMLSLPSQAFSYR